METNHNEQWQLWRDRVYPIIHRVSKSLRAAYGENKFVPEGVILMTLNYEIAIAEEVGFRMGINLGDIPADIKRDAIENLYIAFSEKTRAIEEQRLSNRALERIATSLTTHGWTIMDVVQSINHIVKKPPGPQEIHDLRTFIKRSNNDR